MGSLLPSTDWKARKATGCIFEFAAEELKQMRVCPLREAGISDTIVAVEYHRASAFEEFSFVFVAGEVYLFFYGEAFVFDVLQYFGAAFEATINCDECFKYPF